MSVLAVIDTNVLVSAMLSKHVDAATVQIVDKVFCGEIVPLISEKIIAEYEEVLHRPKFRFPEEITCRLLGAVRQNGIDIDPIMTGEVLPDPKDLVFYEVAMTKQDESAYLVTGNLKHFPIKSFIVTPSEMINILSI